MRAQYRVFFFIFIAFVIGLIVIVGYRGISSILQTADDAAVALFVEEFTRDVQHIGSEPNATQQVTYTLPSSVEQLCVVGSEKQNTTCSVEQFPLINIAYPANNVFLLGAQPRAFSIENIDTVDCQVVCFPTANFTIKGTGTTALIQESR